MAPLIDPLIRLLSTPEGNLIYSLLLGSISLGALIGCLYARGKQISPTARRMQLGFILLLVMQIIYFAVAWMAWIGWIDTHYYLPVLDRTVALISLVLVIWLWAFPKAQIFADVVFVLFEAALILLGVGGMILWFSLGRNDTFSNSMLGGYSYFLGLGLLIFGLILLVALRPRYWGYGSIMLLFMLGGYFGEYLMGTAAGDFVWYEHVGEIGGSILLLTLPLRLIEEKHIFKATGLKTPTPAMSSGRGVQLLESVMNLFTETSPQQYYQELTQVVAEIMHADFCLLMMQPKTGEQLIFPVGYSQLQAKMLDGFSLEAGKLPSIIEAIKNGKSMLVTGEKSVSEVQALAAQLGMAQETQLAMVPFQLQGISAVLSLCVLSNPTETRWNEEDVAQLKNVAAILVTKASQYSKGASRHHDLVEMTQKLERAEAYADQVRLEYAQLKAKYDSISDQVITAPDQSQDLAILVENQKNLQETIDELERRNKELENLLARGRPSMDEVEQLRQELRSALADLARIPSTLSKSDQRMLESQLSAVKHLDGMQPTELVTSIAQEFRQPLSSIIGYTDLLLGESVGILGAMQRKFLEQVKASTERISILLNELVQVMSIDGGRVDQTPVSVDLKSIIDGTVANIGAQLGEKNISMRMALPGWLPTIRINKDALEQILSNLLENACLVTRTDGEIALSVNVEQKDNLPSYILISVADQGGGIQKEDIPHVFLRRYKMENPIIKGIGDTGVGLSIVKSLVELYKGRVWVDTKEGFGSTFSVLLPLAEGQPDQAEQVISTG